MTSRLRWCEVLLVGVCAVGWLPAQRGGEGERPGRPPQRAEELRERLEQRLEQRLQMRRGERGEERREEGREVQGEERGGMRGRPEPGRRPPLWPEGFERPDRPGRPQGIGRDPGRPAPRPPVEADRGADRGNEWSAPRPLLRRLALREAMLRFQLHRIESFRQQLDRPAEGRGRPVPPPRRGGELPRRQRGGESV